MAEKAILFDATRCTACRGCQAACKQWNENDDSIDRSSWTRTVNNGTYENPPDLSPNTWIKMQFREVENNGKLRWLFTRKACMHCTDAGCIRVCPTGAVYRHDLGFVAYNKDICTGCGYCVEACPFDVPRYTRNILTGSAKMDKCVLCTAPGLNRIDEGLEPACVKTCPPKALQYGDRDKLIAEGRKRVEALKANGYPNAYLFGDKELQGLHSIYVLEDNPEVYGLPANPQVSGVTLAWQSVLQPLGLAVGGVTLVGLGLNYLVARANHKKEE